MTYKEFRSVVEEMVGEIPEAFLQELQGVHVLEDAKPEDAYQDVWRMGEYMDPGPEDFLGASDGLGRHVALYYGSFVRIAEGDPGFDWHDEIWETLTHELQHHVESLAGDGRLIEEDLVNAQAFEPVDAPDDAGDASPREPRGATGDASDEPHERTTGQPGRGLGAWLRSLFGGDHEPRSG